jgi:uncharacterized membrane protein
MNVQKVKLIIKDHFLSGLIVLAPILIVLIVFQWVFGGLFDLIHEVTGTISPAWDLLIVIGVVLAGVIIVSLVGLFSRLYFGKKVFEWLKEGIEKIPFFGSIYSTLEQLFNAVSSKGGKQFNRVVFIEYPRKDVWAVAFVTGNANLKGIPQGYLSVFIPTVPNPTSGFHLMVKETEVVESGMKVDDAFKLILSLGVATPNE